MQMYFLIIFVTLILQFLTFRPVFRKTFWFAAPFFSNENILEHPQLLYRQIDLGIGTMGGTTGTAHGPPIENH